MRSRPHLSLEGDTRNRDVNDVVGARGAALARGDQVVHISVPFPLTPTMTGAAQNAAPSTRGPWVHAGLIEA